MLQEKIRVGIIFGGQSREREISFAGGRTVYDNLNKSLFEAIPLFVDSFGNFVELDWQYVYKGTIRDFYPPVDFIPADSAFQLYAENLNPDEETRISMIRKIGFKLELHELKTKIDFAFLCLHGPFGEDGRIQGLFEYLGIPYSGSGILPSSIGINKAIQKDLMVNKGFNSPKYLTIDRTDWIQGKTKNTFSQVKQEIGFPCVVKPAGQGSSIGISILYSDNEFEFMSAVEKALFTRWLDAAEWSKFTNDEKFSYVKGLADIRESLGMPLRITYPENLNGQLIHNPEEFITYIDANPVSDGYVLEATDAETTVLIESFISGKEFSCIVIEDENGKAIALPPTEIRKGKELFDYRSKYLPGLSRKITPIDLPEHLIEAARTECERLFRELHFDVYARIDGFIDDSGKVFLNDPNTTSGMMPSSFFFHQAAEIGLNPSRFLTYIIRTSLAKRIESNPANVGFMALLKLLDSGILVDKNAQAEKVRVAVILGGYSSERHISVESGRNVYEKLASSEKYTAFPVFLDREEAGFAFYHIPVNLLLKDNADDIKEKINKYAEHPIIKKIREQCADITSKYAGSEYISKPERLELQDLKQRADEVFIALHGRPGEDGALQEQLDGIGLPYNGSGKESSSLTIDKYRTNELLKTNGFLVAEHILVSKNEWLTQREKILDLLTNRIKFPFIAKPVDDGCSSAVKKIDNLSEFEAFCTLIFRTEAELDVAAAKALHIKPKEEFPIKQVLLVEELISRRDADHFLEITGGMLTRFDSNADVVYQVFEASEALADSAILSLEEKFLAGQGQNITPARYAKDAADRQKISDDVKAVFAAAAKVLGVSGYCRIDAFVRVYSDLRSEVIFIEVNSLPGMTPATCIFHQAALSHYKPYDFIDRILDFGKKRLNI